LTSDSYDGSTGISLDAMLNINANEPYARDSHWKKATLKAHPEVCIPTNPGTLLHPGSCTPCAFVFRVAEGQVRNRCTNGDACGWCHHPSHPRTRGRRQKSGGRAAFQKEETWTEKNAWTEKNGSETSTRDSSEKEGAWTDGYEGAKTNRAGRDDRAKNNRQRNGRDERSNGPQNPAGIGQSPEKVGLERCNTPEFDEQYSQYASPQQQYQHPQQILYSCIPVHVAVPTSTAEGMTTEWAGYSPTPIYMPDWNSQYQPEVGLCAPQPYVMVQMATPAAPPAFPGTGDAPDEGAAQGAPREPSQPFPALQQWVPHRSGAASGHGAAAVGDTDPDPTQRGPNPFPAAQQWVPNRNRLENIGLERFR
jgi:hypothetical protein